MSSKQIVLTAGTELFTNRDPSAVDRYWAAGYRQHSALAPDGPEGLKVMSGHLPPDFRFEPWRVLEDGNMVAVHGLYHGFGPGPTVAVDVFRVEEGRIAEHWDALAPLPPGSEGTRWIDGDTEITDRDHTAANKALVTDWVRQRLIGNDHQAFEELARTPDYTEHAPTPGLMRNTLHRVIGEGNFVLTLTQAHLDSHSPTPPPGHDQRHGHGEDQGPGSGSGEDQDRDDHVLVGCYDLWRLTQGRIVEHWQVVQPVPRNMPHHNGFF